MNRTFPLSVILTVYHNKMLSSFDELRDILDYMTGTDVPLWEIPRARALCSARLVKEYPWLGDVQPHPEMKKEHGRKFVREVVKKTQCPDELAAPRLPKGRFSPRTLTKTL